MKKIIYAAMAVVSMSYSAPAMHNHRICRQR